MARLWHVGGFLLRQSRTSVTRRDDQLVQNGRVVPRLPWRGHGAATWPRHIRHASDRVWAKLDPSGRPPLRSVDPLCRAGVSVPERVD